MPDRKPWYEDDRFWNIWGATMFNPRRQADAPAEVDKLMTLLNLKPGDNILDLCCGIGRHSLELAHRGFKVTGVDRTSTYLDIASRQAEKKGLKVEFIREDMRVFCQPDTYDAVINMFTSFGYFEDPVDDRKVTVNMFRSLKKGGRFLIDVRGKETLARDFRERDWREEDGALVLEERKVTQDWSRIENRWILIKDGKINENTLSLRLYSAAEIKSLLTDSGFRKVDIYGDYTSVPYDQNARRLVAIAHK
jgi:SAM-dependent methyltransferase